MRAVLLRSLIVIGAGGLVLAGVLYVASTVDARPPQVLEVGLTQPHLDDSNRALITTSLEVVFSEPVDVASAVSAFDLEPRVEGSVSWSGSSMTFTPDDPLELSTSYSASIGPGVRDLAGNEMSELPPPFEFETAGRPELVEANPTDGSEDVPTDQPVVLTFSTLMDTASVDAALRLRPSFGHELRWSGRVLEIVPTDPLRAGMEYEISVSERAADVAGVTLEEPISLRFRTGAPGLAADVLVPADGIAGIAPTSPIAVIFDRPIDPDSVSDDIIAIVPDVAGSLEVVADPDDPPTEDGSGRILRFTPSGRLPPNTTFEVELAPDVAAVGGGRLTGPLAWSFTTGAPQSATSNQVTFITDRSGVANVWAMNADGTGQHQLSTELVPVVDYAIAPDGGSLVVSDGRRLVYSAADGSDRRQLTEDGLLEFDPAFAPDGQRVAFARADSATGEGLGLWEWEIGGGGATPIEIPPELREPLASADTEQPPLRSPRYSPDGRALAFIDTTGAVAILELPAESLTLVPFDPSGAPVWMPDSTSLLLTGRRLDDGPDETAPFEAPVVPLAPTIGDEVFRLARSGTSVSGTPFGTGASVIAVNTDGQIAYVDGSGALWLTDLPNTVSEPPIVDDVRVRAGAFAPGEPAMVIVVGADAATGRLELLDLESGTRTLLAPQGSHPRWLP